MDLKEIVRNIPDFPKPGIQFKDITPILSHPDAFRYVIENLSAIIKKNECQAIVATEARGFIFGSALAFNNNLPFIPVRKPGKLPADKISIDYALEYGHGSLDIHKDALEPQTKVALIDDLLATGGTAKASASLVEQLGGIVQTICFVIELNDLKGRELLKNYNVNSLINY